MPALIPTFSQIMAVAASRGQASDAPGLWNGLVGAWPLQEGGGLTAFDVSGFGNRCTLITMDPATDWVVAPQGRALDFDGSNDRVLSSTIAGPVNSMSDVSVIAWIYPTAAGEGPGLPVIAQKGTLTGTYWRLKYQDQGGTPKSFGFIVGFETLANFLAPANSVPWNAWTQVGATIADLTDSAAVPSLYVNGRSVAVNPNPAGSGAAPTDGTYLFLGNSPAADRTFAGRIFGVTVWNRVLLPAEIARLYADPWAMYRLRRRVWGRMPATGNRRRRMLIGACA